MDYIYSVDLNTYFANDGIKEPEQCCCSLSNRNLLALANDCCVYILPLEKPNELIPVNLNNSPCVDLSWSEDGQFLMNICKNGVCNLYNIKTNSLNTIERILSFQIDKNDFISTKSFNKLPRLCLDHSKQESNGYFEKFTYNPYSSLKDYLSVDRLGFNGFLILTNSGKLHLCFTDFNSVKKKYETFEFDMKLSESQNTMDLDAKNKDEITYEIGDFFFEADGSLVVAYTNYNISTPIYIYKIMFKFSNEKSTLEGTCDLISTLTLTNTEQLTSKSKILFTNKEIAGTLCVQLTNNQTITSTLQFWQASKDTHDSTISQKTNWSIINTLQCASELVDLKITKNEINFKNLKSFDKQPYNFFLLTAYKNGQLGYIDTENFNQTFLSQIPSKESSQNFTTAKRLKKSGYEYIVTLDQSFSGLMGVGITNKCNLIAFRQPEFKSSQRFNASLNVQELINFYEFSLITGNDYWDIIISTCPSLIDTLVEILETNFINQQSALIKKAFFTRFYSLIFALSRRSTTSAKNQSKSLDILTKLILNRSIAILSSSIQINLNVESLITLFANSNSNYINTAQTVPLINTNLISTNLDYINNQTMVNSPTNSFNHIPLKTNLNDYFNEIIKLDSMPNSNSNEPKLTEIVQSILNRKNTSITVNQQLKHLSQWIVDLALILVGVTVAVHRPEKPDVDLNSETDIFGATLIKDIGVLNEIRKGLLFVKILFSLNQPNYGLPVLPYRSMGYQKDLLGELFSITTRLIYKINDRTAIIDESLIDQCLSIQADTSRVYLDKRLFNLRHSWFGLSTSNWLKTFHFPVDYLFVEERERSMYPLFDIVRLVQFSRSSLTKQCIRCGNFTEASCSTSQSIPQNNGFQGTKSQSCILMQDLCGDKCICGGSWVLSPIQ